MRGIYKRNQKIQLADGTSKVIKSKTYHISYYNEFGKQKREDTGCVLKREAEDLRIRLLGKVNQAKKGKQGLQYDQSDSTSNPVKRIVDSYLAAKKPHLKQRTYADYEASLKDLLLGGVRGRAKPFIKIDELEDLKPSHIHKFQNKAQKAGLSNRSINRKLKALTQLVNWAIDDAKILKNNPLGKVQLLRDKPRKATRALNDKEVADLLSEAEESERDVWIFCLNSGFRLNEVYELKWKGVDLNDERGYVSVSSKVAKSHEKRSVPMNKTLRAMLEKRYSGQGNGVHVFKGIGKWKNLYQGALKTLKATCKRAGVEAITVHDLRRTFITNLIVKGVDPVTVAKWAGHADSRITMEIYTKINARCESVASKIDLLD